MQQNQKRTTTPKGRKAATPGQDKSMDERQGSRKIRRDADMPRMNARDIFALCWVGEQGAASSKNLQELLARPDMRELLGNLAGKTPREVETLSAARIRHVIEDHWALAGMVHCETMLGKKWVWPTRRALHAAGLPFSPHRPAGIWIHRNEGNTADSSATIEVEISAKRPATLRSILHELAIYAGTVWYFVDMDPKQGVFSGLIEILEDLEDRFKSRFYFYDLAEPDRLVYHYERKSQVKR